MTRKAETKAGVREAEAKAAKNASRALVEPVTSNAAVLSTLSKPLFGESDFVETFNLLLARTKAVKAGDLSSVEETLVAQAAMLNHLFLDLARRSHMNLGEYINAAERYMRLALKAQSQCRATLETLAAIKNPTLVIAKQANISSGPQQVNNGVARAGNLESVPNGLLEANGGAGERLDRRTTGAAIGGYQALEAVGASDGPAHS